MAKDKISIALIAGVSKLADETLAAKVRASIQTDYREYIDIKIYDIPGTRPKKGEALKDDKKMDMFLASVKSDLKTAENLKTDLVAMGCSTAYAPSIFNKVQSLTQLPFISMEESLTSVAKEATKIGILTFDEAMPVFEAAFKGKELVVPDPKYVEAFVTASPEEKEKRTLGALENLQQKGVSHVMIGRTDMMLLLESGKVKAPEKITVLNYFDPFAALVAEKAVSEVIRQQNLSAAEKSNARMPLKAVAETSRAML